MASSETLDIRLVRITYGAPGINIYRFADKAGGPLPPVEPGSHVDIEVAPGLTRSYSLLWPQPSPDAYEVAVKHAPAGRGGSRALHERAVVGSDFKLVGPRNHFAPDPEADAGNVPAVLLAGGIGITPLIGHYRWLKAKQRPVRLYYWARRAADMLFAQELQAAEPGSVRLIATAEQHDDLRLATLLPELPSEAALFCCGPAAMLDAFDALTTDREPARLHRERFAPAVPPTTDGDDSFEVRLERSGMVLAINAGETILNACLNAGIDAAYSCEEGVCGACEVKVLSGAILHRDSVLSPAEQAGGDRMMICCSRARGNGLVIDL